MAEETSGRLLTRPFVLLSLADLAYFTAAGILLAVTPFFASRVLGADTIGVGVAMGAFSLTTLALRPWVGRAADRWGRRAPMLVGAAAFAGLTLCHALVTDLVGLVAVRLALGAAEALFFVAGFAALADLAPPGRAGEALSLNSLALFAGMTIGPVLGQQAIAFGGFGPAWAGAAGLCAGAAVLVTLIPETKPAAGPDQGPGALLHRPSLSPGFGLFAGVAVSSAFLGFAGLYAQELGIEGWGLVLGTYGATVVTCRLAFARVPDRVPSGRLAGIALGLQVLGMVGLATVRQPAGLFGAAVMVGVGVAFLTPAVFALVMGHLNPGETGAAAATLSIFIDLGLSSGPVLLGLLAAGVGVPAGFLLLGALPLAGLTVVVRRHR